HLTPSRLRQPPSPPIFPYTTLFRSQGRGNGLARIASFAGGVRHHVPAAECKERGADPENPFSNAGCGAGPGRPQKTMVCPTGGEDRKSTRLNSSHVASSYAVFCLEK